MSEPTSAPIMDSGHGTFVRRQLHEELERIDRALAGEEKAAREDAKEHGDAIKKLKAERNDILEELENPNGRLPFTGSANTDEDVPGEELEPEL